MRYNEDVPGSNADALGNALAASLLRRRAVTLDPALRYGRDRAHPHFVPFIPYPYQYGSPSPNGDGFYTVTATQAEGPDGLTVASNGGQLDIPVRLDRDADYHILWIRYTAFIPGLVPGIEQPGVGSRGLLLPPYSLYAVAGVGSAYTALGNQYIPYTSFLDVTAYLPDAGARDYYGGLAQDSMTQNPGLLPVAVQALQTSEDGVGCIRLAAQLPASGLVTLRFTNNYSSNLQVNGHLFGYKVLGGFDA